MVDLRERADMIEKAVNDFGRFLYDFRMKNKISLQQMAEKVFVNASYLCRIENGNRKPDFDVRIRILTLGMHWSVIDVMLYLE